MSLHHRWEQFSNINGQSILNNRTLYVLYNNCNKEIAYLSQSHLNQTDTIYQCLLLQQFIRSCSLNAWLVVYLCLHNRAFFCATLLLIGHCDIPSKSFMKTVSFPTDDTNIFCDNTIRINSRHMPIFCRDDCF